MDISRRYRSLRIQALVLLAALLVQYGLGMAVNLFIQFPQGAVGGQLWEFAWSRQLIASHIILAILILLGGIVLLVRALLYKSKVWVWCSAVALLAILWAGGSGAQFIASQDNLFSYSMSLAFLIAIGAYGVGIYLSA